MVNDPRQRKKAASGFSLGEVAVVLGVVGVFLGGIWGFVGVVRNNARQERFSEMLNATAGNMRSLYAGKGFVESTSVPTMMPVLTKLYVFPNDAVMADSATGKVVVVSPFGRVTSPVGSPYNSFYVCGWTAKSNTSCDFAGGTSNVPLFAVEALFADRSACAAAALRNANPYTTPGLVAVYINGNQLTLPTTAALVNQNTLCGKNGTSIVDFVFKLSQQ